MNANNNCNHTEILKVSAETYRSKAFTKMFEKGICIEISRQWLQHCLSSNDGEIEKYSAFEISSPIWLSLGPNGEPHVPQVL